jgi:hypothetical protein
MENVRVTLCIVTRPAYESREKLLQNISTSHLLSCYKIEVRVSSTVVTGSKYESQGSLLHA